MNTDVEDGMAKAMFAVAWADMVEERGGSLTGEIMNLIPEVDPAAEKKTEELVKEIEELNGRKMEEIVDDMYVREGVDPESGPAELEESFGHYLAMQSLGHGVAWSDDHEDHNLKLPYIEFGEWDFDLEYDNDGDPVENKDE